MRRLLVAVTTLTLVALLSACSGIPFFRSDDMDADAQMAKISDAINNHDAAALAGLFTARAVEQAPDLEAGVNYLLSLFPDGGITWERNSLGAAGTTRAGVESYLVLGDYKVAADGVEYRVDFQLFTVNHDSKNVGLYALGATPWTEDIRSGAAAPFTEWLGAIQYDGTREPGYSGIYVPEEGDESPAE